MIIHWCILCRQELLAGPLLYIAVVIATTVQFWRHSPAGLLALCMMCVGDGLADIVGRRYGTTKLPYNASKTWAGSLAMFAGKSDDALTVSLCTYFLCIRCYYWVVLLSCSRIRIHNAMAGVHSQDCKLVTLRVQTGN